MIDRMARSSDASPFKLIPKAIVFPKTSEEVGKLFALSKRMKVPVTFRAGGTSLNGQAVTDGILCDVSRFWKKFSVEAEGALVRIQPGVIGGEVNRALAPFNRKIGPDPASIESCMIGGIVANNSGGMCCGVEFNAFHTLQSIRFTLPSGTEIDSAQPDADEQLAKTEPHIHAGLAKLRAETLANPELMERIKRKYRTKNTVGYGLNSITEFTKPIDILSHLMVGSEGTLGFFNEVTLRTVSDPPLKLTGILMFRTVEQAIDAVPELRQSRATAVELMDSTFLRNSLELQKEPLPLGPISADSCALLVEYQFSQEAELEAAGKKTDEIITRLGATSQSFFTSVTDLRLQLWAMRRGPPIKRVRAQSIIVEDVGFQPERLADGVRFMQAILPKFGFVDVPVYGHAKDGNLHFVISVDLSSDEGLAHFQSFMKELVEGVHQRQGTLKGEHGTGRSIAPFVEDEWGSDGKALMVAIKQLIDPSGILSPNVIITDNPRNHLENLKQMPEVSGDIDRCFECGLCDRLISDPALSLRQEIVLLRAVENSTSISGETIAEELKLRHGDSSNFRLTGQFPICPVGIDLKKRLRMYERRGWTPGLMLRKKK